MACLDENEVVALLSGGLRGDALQVAQQHLDGCEECLDLVGLFQQAEADEENPLAERRSQNHETPVLEMSESEEINFNAKPGSKIGRYEILRPIGRGGMGVVYLATDPKLGRKVAIKLVKPSLKADDRVQHYERRLMREARAMAQLTHPNVLTIYDVGMHGDQVFLASEWVDGATLEDWICEHTHHWQSIVTMFRGAARGLAAAHEAGLIHRDFKPSNVMIGKDHRVLVFDFGLVKSTRATMGEITTQLSGNFIVGTPAYMSPEQMVGDPADERSDQFSFCASLYESIAGKRPFAGRSLVELLSNIKAGKIEEPRKIPKWLWELLKRGLQRKPEDRYPSMNAVLAVMDAGLADRRRRKLFVGLGVAGLLGVGVAAAMVMQRGVTAEEVCGAKLQEVKGAWDAPRRQATKEGLLSSETDYAAAMWQSVSSSLDRYSSELLGQSHASCLETKLTGKQREETFVRRNLCFERLRTQLDVVTQRLQAGDLSSVQNAFVLVQGLDPVSSCQPSALDGMEEVYPLEPGKRRTLWQALKMLEISLVLGHETEAQLRAESLLSAPVGSRVVEAKLYSNLGFSLKLQREYAQAVQAFESAFYAAVAGKDDGIAAQATCEIVSVQALRLHDEGAAARWQQLARSAVERDGSPGALGIWHRTLGSLAQQKGQLRLAEKEYRESLELLSLEYGDEHLEVAKGLVLLGRSLLALHNAEAVTRFEQLIALHKKSVGPLHPKTAEAEVLLASALHQNGKTEEATALATTALSSLIEGYGERHAEVSRALNVLAELAVAAGDFEAANRDLLRAIRIKQQVYGPQSLRLVSTLLNLMEVDRMRGRYSDVVVHGSEALELLASSAPAKDPKGQSEAHQKKTLRIGLAMAEAQLANKEWARAQVLCQEAFDSFSLNSSLLKGRLVSCLARAKRKGSRTEALDQLSQAIALLGPSEGVYLAMAQLAMAEDLLDAPDRQGEGQRLAKEALAGFSHGGMAWKGEAAQAAKLVKLFAPGGD